MTPKQRQQTIREIIETSRVRSQKELGEKLALKGFDVAQSTLSRDIAELGLVKGATGYAHVPPQGRELTSGRELRSKLRAFVVDIEAVANQVLVKTTSGGANAAADALDDSSWSEVAGTIAGDDTILIIARNPAKAKKVVNRIRQMLS